MYVCVCGGVGGRNRNCTRFHAIFSELTCEYSNPHDGHKEGHKEEFSNLGLFTSGVVQ